MRCRTRVSWKVALAFAALGRVHIVQSHVGCASLFTPHHTCWTQASCNVECILTVHATLPGAPTSLSDLAGAQAAFKDGTLHLTIPKKEKEINRNRQIAIE